MLCLSMAKINNPLLITDEQRRTLKIWISAHKTPQSIVTRAKIILMAADGLSNVKIAKELHISRPTVILWRARFLEGGPQALTTILHGRGRPVTYTSEKVQSIIEATTQTKPPAATHWSTRSMAKAQGVSKATVQRIWNAHGLQPHLTQRFKLSTDRNFTEKLTDVVGLYLNPPDKAIVLCVDEKSQIQALQRTQPGLPLKKGRCGTMTHDYKRNGTTTLFAALEVVQGKVIGQCYARHRHQEFLKFLKRLDAEFPVEMKLHLVMDNYGTHKHPRVQGWVQRHPRFVPHFIPTSSSWLNLVERWFGELTGKRIRRGSFVSGADLVAAIEEYLAAWNAKPKPFIWTATVDSIIDKLTHCKQTLERIQPGCTLPRTRKRKNKSSCL